MIIIFNTVLEIGIFSTDEAGCINEASTHKLAVLFETRCPFIHSSVIVPKNSNEKEWGESTSYFVLLFLQIENK